MIWVADTFLLDIGTPLPVGKHYGAAAPLAHVTLGDRLAAIWRWGPRMKSDELREIGETLLAS